MASHPRPWTIKTLVGIASCIVLIAGDAAAQTGNGRTPAFEVASVKQSPPSPGTYRANLGSMRHGQVILTNVTLSDCLRFAFDVTTVSQISGPDWMRDKSVRFDIVAKAAPETPDSELRFMLQNLLIDRFRMTLHREQRDLSFLALLPGKKGLKMREAQPDSDASSNRLEPGLIRSNRLSTTILAMLLSRFLREPVMDMTGLSGFYEVRLEWTPDTLRTSNPMPAGEPSRAAESGGADVSIFSAIQDQLGLKLESRKGPAEVIVVDHTEREPVAN